MNTILIPLVIIFSVLITYETFGNEEVISELKTLISEYNEADAAKDISKLQSQYHPESYAYENMKKQGDYFEKNDTRTKLHFLSFVGVNDDVAVARVKLVFCSLTEVFKIDTITIFRKDEDKWLFCDRIKLGFTREENKGNHPLEINVDSDQSNACADPNHRNETIVESELKTLMLEQSKANLADNKEQQLKNIHPESMTYKVVSEPDYTFDNNDVKIELLSLSLVGVDDDYSIARVKLESTYFWSNHLTEVHWRDAIMVFRLHKDRWLLWDDVVIEWDEEGNQANQKLDPTVTTPVESGKVQGTAGQL